MEGRAVTKVCMEGLSRRLSFISVVLAMFWKSKHYQSNRAVQNCWVIHLLFQRSTYSVSFVHQGI